MMDRSVATRYAKVLFDLDCVKENLEQRVLDFELIIKILKDNPKLVNFLKAPHIHLNEKKSLLQNLLKETFDSSFLDFLSYLIQRGRIVNLSDIANEYRHKVNEYLGVWETDIVTAVPMDDETETKLIQKLEKDFHKKIKLNKKIDPNILGGIVLIIDNEMLDWSVIGRLRKLKENLMTTQIGAQ